jgi:predicted O-methyltransferase YrrM
VAEYVYDQTWHEERNRLRGMEALWDPGTTAILERLGLGAGARCLEVGAGAGSVAEWMAEQVGDEGEVLATDVSTRYLSAVEASNLRVMEHDIRSDALPEGHFDFAHARLVVEHLGRPALDAITAAVKPGGVVFLEDYDFSTAVSHPEIPEATKALAAVLEFMSRAGFDPAYGRKLSDELTDVGLEGVEAEGRLRVYRGGSPGTAFMRLSLESLRGAIVEAGLISDGEVERMLAHVDDPAVTFLSPVLVAAWGRRPA